MKSKSAFWICALLALTVFPIQAEPVVVSQASEGGEHTAFVESDGSLWTLGRNFEGQLGVGESANIFYTDIPQQVEGAGVTTVAAGGEYTLFLKSDGSLWGMGQNNSGQIAGNTNESQFSPEQIDPGEVTAIAAGNAHTLYIKSGGSLWVMGDDLNGDLGDGTNVARSTPKMIEPSGVIAIAAGTDHSLFAKSDGSLWAMGGNGLGQLGNGTTNASNVPIQILPGGSGVIAVAAGEEFSLVLKEDGSVWGMGWDNVGQLGDGGNPSNAVYSVEKIIPGGVTAIAAGQIHSLFLVDNTIWAAGDDVNGELGDGNCCFTRFDRFIAAETVPGDITAIAAGGVATIFIESDGSLWGAGYSGYGQLGPGASSRPAEIVPDLPFTASPTNGQVPLSVQFNTDSTDTFGGTIVSWNWDFGDGSTSDLQNPVHIYTTLGTFTPTLSAMDNLGHEVVGSGPAEISTQPTNILYSASPTNGLAPLTVNFSASRTDPEGNTIVYWSWNFGDGTSSGLPSLSHTYSNPGTYTVSLVATNVNGDSLTGTGPTNIKVLPHPTIAFNATPESGPAPLSVSFTAPGVDSLGNTIVSWSWDFGDGVGTSTEQDPTYIYTATGFYSPTLTVENNLGEFFDGTGPLIEADPPTVLFTACPTNASVPVTVQFTAPSVDGAGNPILDWNWDFGDGVGTSTEQNPAYVYTTPGTYYPALYVDNSVGDYIEATGPSLNLSAGTFDSGLVVNGGFETGDFTGWTLVSPSGNFDTAVDNSFALSGNYGADFFEEGSLDYISQALPTTPGTTYVLSFWLNSPDGLTPNEFLAKWNTTTLFDQTNISAIGWTNLQFVVTATTSSSLLQFGGQDDPSDLGLDDVSVTLAQPGIASLVLSGSNLVLTGSNGVSGQRYYVLENTNLTAPLNKWIPILTNIPCMNGPFTITITNAVQPNVSQEYFVVELK